MSHPLTPRHDRPLQQQVSFRLPEEITSKGAPVVVEPMGEISPPPYSFQVKERGAEPIMVQGFEGWAPKGFDSRPRATESGTTAGKPTRGQGPSKQNTWDTLSHVRDR